MTPIGDVINLALERLIARMADRSKVVSFPLTDEMRMRLAIVAQIKREREAR